MKHIKLFESHNFEEDIEEYFLEILDSYNCDILTELHVIGSISVPNGIIFDIKSYDDDSCKIEVRILWVDDDLTDKLLNKIKSITRSMNNGGYSTSTIIYNKYKGTNVYVTLPYLNDDDNLHKCNCVKVIVTKDRK